MGKREFEVPRKGTGKPDFYQTSAPARPILGHHEGKWYCLWSGDIDAGHYVTVPIYQGEEGWRLNFGGGFISVNAKVICSITCEIEMPAIGYPYIEVIEFWYELQGKLNFVEPSIVIIEEDENMQFKIYNRDSSSHHFSLTLLGMEEKV